MSYSVFFSNNYLSDLHQTLMDGLLVDTDLKMLNLSCGFGMLKMWFCLNRHIWVIACSIFIKLRFRMRLVILMYLSSLDAGMIWYYTIWYDMMLYDMVWYTLLLRHFIWYCMILYSMVWYDIIRYGMILYGIIQYYTMWYYTIWYDTILFDMIWYDTILYDMIRYYMIWFDMILYDIV